MRRHQRSAHPAGFALARRQQRGIALVVVLIMVLLVTLAGIAAVRTLVGEERMAANSFDRGLAMQSAERVLREAEDIALAQSKTTPANIGFPANNNAAACADATVADASPCNLGLCAKPNVGCAARWEHPSFAGWKVVTSSAPATAQGATVGDDATLALNTQQQYIIEYLGNNFACDPSNPDDAFDCRQYRITVRSMPNAERAVVQLQSYFLAQP